MRVFGLGKLLQTASEVVRKALRPSRGPKYLPLVVVALLLLAIPVTVILLTQPSETQAPDAGQSQSALPDETPTPSGAGDEATPTPEGPDEATPTPDGPDATPSPGAPDETTPSPEPDAATSTPEGPDATPSPAGGGQGEGSAHPNVFLNAAEITAIKSRIDREPWKSAYDALIGSANAALNSGTFSITRNGGPPEGSAGTYHSDRPYCGWKRMDGREPDCRDGQYNPNADRGDYIQAIGVGEAVRSLGLAYALTDDVRYAEKAVELIRVWTLDATTRMSPQYTKASQSQIELSITMPGLFYGADLIYNYPGWDPNEKAAFMSWTGSLIESAKGWQRDNNFENWRLVMISTASALVEDDASFAYAVERYKEIIPSQIDSRGRMTQELRRTDSLEYSTYALNAMVQTAEVARHQGINLYDYSVDGRGLRLALDYHAAYVADPGAWSYPQNEEYGKDDNVALFELAYSYYKDDHFRQVITAWGRPFDEKRTMGDVTLTHGYDPDQPETSTACCP